MSKTYQNEEKPQEEPIVTESEVANEVLNTPNKPTESTHNPTIIDPKIEGRYFKVYPNGDIIMGDYDNGQGVKWDQIPGFFRIRGSLTAGSIDIPDNVTANSFHVDSSGNMWSGAATYNLATNPFAVSNEGDLRATKGTIAGWTINATSLSKTIINLDAGNDRITVDTNKVILDSSGITAIAGTIGGFTLADGNLYGGIIKTAATVALGSTGVIMDTDGLRGYDSVLGKTFV